MNWFERYGIVGLYFVGCVGVWGALLFSDGMIQEIDAKKLAVVGVVLSLPAGYVLSIFSQLLYYLIPFPWQIHREIWHKRSETSEFKTYLKQHPILQAAVAKHTPDKNGKQCSELMAEALITVVFRGQADTDSVDRGRWVQQFTSRRWDVFAINNSIVLSTILAPLAAIVLEVQFPGWEAVRSAWYVFPLALIVAGLCVASSCCMSSQIKTTLAGYWVVEPDEASNDTAP